MDRFCQHCGKELKGDESRCPECGMPTGDVPTQQMYSAPPKKNTNVWIIVIAVAAVVCIALIAVIPALIPQTDSYTVTVTLEEFSIDLEDKTQYGGALLVSSSLTIRCGGVSKTLGPWNNCSNSGTMQTPNFNNQVTFRVTTSDLESLTYSVFLNMGPNHSPSPSDTVDIYKVDTSKVTSALPKSFGCSGVSFNISDYSGNVSETMDGDCDPIGHIKLVFKAVKN